MSVGIIIQARSGSSRFPRKIYAPFNNGKNSIQCILEGTKKTIVPHKIVLAMPKDDQKEIEKRLAEGEFNEYIDNRFELFIGLGEEDDLVDRYYGAMRKFDIDVCMRITGDCPMHCATSGMMDDMLLKYLGERKSVFMGNDLLVSRVPYPCGIDMEVFNYEMMCWVKMHAKTDAELEHCVTTLYGTFSPFDLYGYENIRPQIQISTRISDFSLDTREDYELLKKLMNEYDKYQDINKAIESVSLSNIKKTNMSKNFRQ